MIFIDGKLSEIAIKTCHILNIDPRELLPKYNFIKTLLDQLINLKKKVYLKTK